MFKSLVLILILSFTFVISAQKTVNQIDVNNYLYDIANAPSAERIEKDIRILAGFGTRHTLSDTVSSTRGIGAARRWIKSEFEQISKQCGNCLEVKFHKGLAEKDDRRIVKDTWVVNVLAIQRGTDHPDRYIIMSGDIDSRISERVITTSTIIKFTRYNRLLISKTEIPTNTLSKRSRQLRRITTETNITSGATSKGSG